MLDFREGKGMTTAQSNEHQRRWNEEDWKLRIEKGNYDMTRERLNFEIVKGGIIQAVDKSKSIPEKMAEILKARGIKDPNNEPGLEKPKFRTVINFMLGGDRERMRELAFGDQKVNWEKGKDNSHIMRRPEIEAWAKDAYDFMCREYGEENIVAFIVHLDETNPHVHCTVLPIAGNKLSYKKVMHGESLYSLRQNDDRLHDEFAKVNKKWGLERGDSVAVTGARHRSTEEYRKDLARQCGDAEATLREYNMTLNDLSRDISLASRRCKGLQTMIDNLEKQQAGLIVEVERIGQMKGIQNADYLAAKKQLEELEAKLEDKRSKLATAEQQLDELRETKSELESELEGLKKGERMARERIYNLSGELAKTASNGQGLAIAHVTTAFYEEALADFRMHMMTNPEFRYGPAANTLIGDMTGNSIDLITVASMLYLGMTGQAAAYAGSHGGGGGGGGDLPWGRDPKEDDRAWARRCAQQARRMMAPAMGRGIKRDR